MGLCIVIDNQEANWEVIRTEQYGTTIKIKNGSIWNVQEYTDPKTGKRKLQIFREGANFNALQITRPAQAEGAAYGNAAENEDQKLRIFYSKWQGLQSPHRAPASFAVFGSPERRRVRPTGTLHMSPTENRDGAESVDRF
jgi:hypothetical protein